MAGGTALRSPSAGVTHVTGAIRAPGENSVVFGSGKFRNAVGSSRLSGAVAMVPLPSGELEITFDCLFVLQLDL